MTGEGRRRIVLLALLVLVAGLAACVRSPGPAAGGGRLGVAVTIAPHAFLAERVGGSRVVVQTLVPPGQDPHTYDIAPAQIASLSGDRLYFTGGFDIERALLPKIHATLKGLRVVDLTAGLDLLDSGPGGGAADPHVWLDPTLALAQARIMRDAFVQADPAGRLDYEEGYRGLAADLEALRERVAHRLAPYRGDRFYVLHPAWAYFARAFGIEQVSLEVEGKEPTARQLGALVRRARSDGAQVVFSEPQAGGTAAIALARQIGARVEMLDPLSASYIEALDRSSAQIASALSAQAARAAQR